MPIGAGPQLRSFVSRYFALQLDGVPVGYLRSVEGGGIKAEVVTHPVGGAAVKTKHIGLPQVEPISVQVGLAMSAKFYQWIADSWAGTISRYHGAVQACDHDLNVQHEQEFKEALITETTIPALDASSKEPAYMTVKFQPELSRHVLKGSGRAKDSYTSDQKRWLPSNFRLTLDGIDCTRVNKIESFTVKQGTKRLEVGGMRQYELEPTSLEYPNLTLTTSLAVADDFFKWHEDFVINGNNGADAEKGGSIEILDAARKKTLLTISLKGVGISNLVVDKGDAGSDSIKRVKIELYVEEMAFQYNG